MGEIEQAGREAEQSTALDRIARVGLLAYGTVHLLIGWLAIQLAVGDHRENPDAQGAFHTLAQQPAGAVLVAAVAIGLLLLALWRVLEAGFGHREDDGFSRLRRRATSAGQAVVYAALGGLAAKTVLGGGGSGSEEGLTAKVMAYPGGTTLVVAVAAGLLVTAGGFWWFAATARFARHLDLEGRTGTSGTAYRTFGRVGYAAKGVAFALVGILLGQAGLQHDPSDSAGLDEALQRVLREPFGPAVLVAIGVGFGCYGLFCFARARHLRD